MKKGAKRRKIQDRACLYVCTCIERKGDRSHEKPVVGKAKCSTKIQRARPNNAKRIIKEKYFNNLAQGYLLEMF